MGKVRSNLNGFVESGGWDFLLEQDENRVPSDNEQLDPNRPPSEDEYVPSDSEDYGSDDYSDDDDDDDFESDEMYSDEDEGGFDDGEEEEEGLGTVSLSFGDWFLFNTPLNCVFCGIDWDELDRRAAIEDRKSSRRETEETRRDRMRNRNNAYRQKNRVSPNNYKKRSRY